MYFLYFLCFVYQYKKKHVCVFKLKSSNMSSESVDHLCTQLHYMYILYTMQSLKKSLISPNYLVLKLIHKVLCTKWHTYCNVLVILQITDWNLFLLLFVIKNWHFEEFWVNLCCNNAVRTKSIVIEIICKYVLHTNHFKYLSR